MIVDLSSEHLEFKIEVRQYIEGMMTDDFKTELKNPNFSHGGGPIYWQKMKKLGADGWIRKSWPADIGGDDADPVMQYIIVDESKRAGFPWPQLSANSIGPVLAKNAQPEIRDEIVNEILNGEAYLAIGYSEPSAGSDLASLTTRAVQEENGDWIINGQKIWTSCANFAKYIWLAARTHPDASKRHKGITLFLVPTDTEGFSCTLIETLGVQTTATYYQDVRIPDKYRISEVNQGWKLITSQLNVERLSLASYGQVSKLYLETLNYIKAEPELKPLLEEAWVQQSLAKCHAKLEALKMLCLKAAWTMESGGSGMVEASATKVYGSELYVEVCRLLSEILGPSANVGGGDGTMNNALLEYWYRKGSVMTFGGGANELQRNIVAVAGLGLPR